MPSRYTFTEYSSNWPVAFHQEAERLRTLLGEEVIAVHHIGSTSVPGLAAKPIIDLLPVVREIAAIDRLTPRLQEAGYKNEPIVFKYSSGNAAVNQYAQVIQSSLTDVGINVQIETLEVNTIRTQLAQGQFQMYTGIWIGGNQDPIFLRDLFATSKIPGGSVACCNRSRYSNPKLDSILEEAVNTIDRETAKSLYIQSQQIVSDELPLFPLWYPANLVVANKRIGNIKLSGSGDWSFAKDLTVQ